MRSICIHGAIVAQSWLADCQRHPLLSICFATVCMLMPPICKGMTPSLIKRTLYPKKLALKYIRLASKKSIACIFISLQLSMANVAYYYYCTEYRQEKAQWDLSGAAKSYTTCTMGCLIKIFFNIILLKFYKNFRSRGWVL